MNIRDIHARLVELSTKHSFRSNQAEELQALWREIDGHLAQGATEARDRARLTWLGLEIGSLLDYYQRQWEILDELERIDLRNRDKILRKRIRLLVQWSKDEGSDAPKLPFLEFRKRAKLLAAEACGKSEVGITTGLLFAADLPHLFPEFYQPAGYSGDLVALWDKCIEAVTVRALEENQLSELTRQMLAAEEEAKPTLIYALLGSVHLAIGRAARSTETGSSHPAKALTNEPTPLVLLERMRRVFSWEQMAITVDYLTKIHWPDFSACPYFEDGATKEVLIQFRYELLAKKEKLAPPEVIQYLRLAISRFEFWEEKAERDKVLAQARQLLAGAGVSEDIDQSSWQEVIGRIYFAAGEEKRAAQHFLKSSELLRAAPGRGVPTSGVQTFCPYEALDFETATDGGPYSMAATGADLTSLDSFGDQTYAGLIVTAADAKYFLKYAEKFIESLRAHDKELPVLFHVIDLEEESREFFAKLARRYAGLFLSHERAVHRQPYYYASVRLLRAHDIVLRAGRPVLFTDIDLEFRTGFRAIFDYGSRFDLMLRRHDSPRMLHLVNIGRVIRYPRLEPWDMVTAGAMMMTATPVGLKMAAAAARLMGAFISKFAGQNATNWFIDQNMLYQFSRWIALQPEVKFGNFEDIQLSFGKLSVFDLLARIREGMDSFLKDAAFQMPK